MNESPSRLITLLTDFGNRDGYVGVMKGVIAQISPGSRTIDISHEIPPQDIRSASFLLEKSFKYFPRDTVHLVVVDPGVGTERAGLVVRSTGSFFVGPDNGVLSPVLERAESVHRIEEQEYWLDEISDTFHGRDIFAPVAARLARGYSPGLFGPSHADPVVLQPPEPEKTDSGWKGEVVYVDRFGNLVTNIDKSCLDRFDRLDSVAVVTADGTVWPFSKTYSTAPEGACCAVVGGFGTLELSINQGSAAERTGFGTGHQVLLQPKG